jgi:hypothetical protein
MKKLGSLMISFAVLVTLFALVETGAKAQSIDSTQFVGKFTLPFEARWGGMILPAGNYNLKFGYTMGGLRVVEVAGEDAGILHGWVFAKGRVNTKGEGSFLVCVLNGNTGYVRSLQLAEFGESINFARPHGVSVDAWIVAGKKSHNAKTQLAETRIPIVPAK